MTSVSVNEAYSLEYNLTPGTDLYFTTVAMNQVDVEEMIKLIRTGRPAETTIGGGVVPTNSSSSNSHHHHQNHNNRARVSSSQFPQQHPPQFLNPPVAGSNPTMFPMSAMSSLPSHSNIQSSGNQQHLAGYSQPLFASSSREEQPSDDYQAYYPLSEELLQPTRPLPSSSHRKCCPCTSSFNYISL